VIDSICLRFEVVFVLLICKSLSSFLVGFRLWNFLSTSRSNESLILGGGPNTLSQVWCLIINTFWYLVHLAILRIAVYLHWCSRSWLNWRIWFFDRIWRIIQLFIGRYSIRIRSSMIRLFFIFIAFLLFNMLSIMEWISLRELS
jgi:hypothetical protein